jgi:predicted aspartyl protease
MSNRLRIPFYFAICTSLLFGMLTTPVAASGYSTNDTSWHTNSAYDITSTVWSDTPTTVIPFTMAGNLIIIKAKADTIEGNFILDTGAPHLVLNITYFRDYKIIQETNEIQTATTGAGASVSRTQIRQFSIGSIHHRKIDADLTNLGHIENIRGIRILGLIGIDLLKQCEMIIDYERSLIYLHHISRKEATGYKSVHLKETSYTTIPFDLKENKIIVYSELGGKKLRFVIDSGAESNLLDSRLPNKIFDNVDITGLVLLTGTANKKIEATTGELRGLRLGTELIGNLPIVITNLEKTCFWLDGCADGVLGFDFLSLHKIGFNFVTRKMYLWK